MAGINIRLGQSPANQDPKYVVELQYVYNSVHTLNAYASAIINAVGGGGGGAITDPNTVDGNPPNNDVPFVNSFWGVAGQPIEVGSVVSSFGNQIVNGVLSSEPYREFIDSSVTVGSTGSRYILGLVPLQYFIALTAAQPGEQVQVGIGPGISKVSGAKCGQVIWAVDSRTVYSTRKRQHVEQLVERRDLLGNGGLYLANVVGEFKFSAPGEARWEGFWMPGYPDHQGKYYLYHRAFLYPVGICVSNDYVLFYNYVHSISTKG